MGSGSVSWRHWQTECKNSGPAWIVVKRLLGFVIEAVWVGSVIPAEPALRWVGAEAVLRLETEQMPSSREGRAVEEVEIGALEKLQAKEALRQVVEEEVLLRKVLRRPGKEEEEEEEVRRELALHSTAAAEEEVLEQLPAPELSLMMVSWKLAEAAVFSLSAVEVALTPPGV